MKKLYVYADFNWLDSPTLVGELTYDAVRGNDTYGFAFSKDWLAKHDDVFLSDDMLSFPGMQYAPVVKDIFACFSDCLPDRWGRTLLNRREQIAAREEKRPARRLSSFDYLMGIDDASRMGGFRFSDSQGGKFINCDPRLRVPPLANIRELMRAAQEIESSEERQVLPDQKWLAQLLRPGTSLGGARPKASVLDSDGALAVAKFSSRNDDYDVGLWEHFCHVMAKKAGINAADTTALAAGKFHILLSKRFDRTTDGRRIHFASALTLMGLTDGDNAATGHGYLDIVDFILSRSHNAEQDLEQLYRRVAFNIIVGNSDDHFRNHGFLLSRKGWELAPAYDLNPTLSQSQSLLINKDTNDANLDTLRDAAGEYMLKADRAADIIAEVKTAMRPWRSVAARLGLPQRDIEMFAPRFEKWLRACPIKSVNAEAVSH